MLFLDPTLLIGYSSGVFAPEGQYATSKWPLISLLAPQEVYPAELRGGKQIEFVSSEGLPLRGNMLLVNDP